VFLNQSHRGFTVAGFSDQFKARIAFDHLA
jgi:hypothetical protein